MAIEVKGERMRVIDAHVHAAVGSSRWLSILIPLGKDKGVFSRW